MKQYMTNNVLIVLTFIIIIILVIFYRSLSRRGVHSLKANPSILKKYLNQIANQISKEYNVDIPYKDFIHMKGKNEDDWLGWGLCLNKPENTENAYIFYLAIEIDEDDYIITEDYKNKSAKMKNSSIIENRIEAISFSSSLIEDDEVAKRISEILQVTVVPVGAIKKNNKKYRTFKWLLIDDTSG